MLPVCLVPISCFRRRPALGNNPYTNVPLSYRSISSTNLPVVSQRDIDLKSYTVSVLLCSIFYIGLEYLSEPSFFFYNYSSILVRLPILEHLPSLPTSTESFCTTFFFSKIRAIAICLDMAPRPGKSALMFLISMKYKMLLGKGRMELSGRISYLYQTSQTFNIF